MNVWIILPFDNSHLAQRGLKETGNYIRERRDPSRFGGVVLAIAGVDPAGTGQVLRSAQQIVGDDITLELRLLEAGDPAGSFRRLTAQMPSAIVATPVLIDGTPVCAPWFAEVCHDVGAEHAALVFLIRAADLRVREEEVDGRYRLGHALRGVLRAGAGLHQGVRAPVKGRAV